MRAEDERTWTTIHLACQNGHLEEAFFLVEAKSGLGPLDMKADDKKFL
jgi:hypothetical protein